jgi:mRNA interferase MazF
VGQGANVAREMGHGEVRLYRFPPPDKQRPVLVLTRNAALRFLHRATVAPITSTIRDIPTEVVIGSADGMKAPCAVNLDNLITVPLAGLGRRVTQLSSARRDMTKRCGSA